MTDINLYLKVHGQGNVDAAFSSLQTKAQNTSKNITGISGTFQQVAKEAKGAATAMGGFKMSAEQTKVALGDSAKQAQNLKAFLSGTAAGFRESSAAATALNNSLKSTQTGVQQLSASVATFSGSFRNMHVSIKPMPRTVKQIADEAMRAAKAAGAMGGGFRTASASADSMASGMMAAGAQTRALGNSAKLSTFDITNLQYQMNDIGVMLASGQSPFVMMMQQGMQVSQIFTAKGINSLSGAAAGFGNALAGFLLSPLNLAVVGLAAFAGALSYVIPKMYDWITGAEEVARSTEEMEEAFNQWRVGIDKHIRGATAAIDRFMEETPDKLTLDLRAELNLEDTRKALARAKSELGDEMTEAREGNKIERLFTFFGANPTRRSMITSNMFTPGFTESMDKMDGFLKQLKLGKMSVEAFEKSILAMRTDKLLPEGMDKQLDIIIAAIPQLAELEKKIQALNDPEGMALANNLREAGEEIDKLLIKAKEELKQQESNRALLEESKHTRQEAIEVMREQALLQEVLRDNHLKEGQATEELTKKMEELMKIRKRAAEIERQNKETLDRRKEEERAAKKLKSAIDNLTKSYESKVAATRAELSVLGMSDEAAARHMARIEAMNKLKEKGIALDSSAAQKILNLADQNARLTTELDKQTEAFDKQKAALEDIQQIGKDAIDGIVDSIVDGTGSIEDIIKNMLKELAKMFLTLGFANPLKNALYGTDLPTASSFGGVGNIFGALTGTQRSAGALPGATLNTANTSPGTVGSFTNTIVNGGNAGNVTRSVAGNIPAGIVPMVANPKTYSGITTPNLMTNLTSGRGGSGSLLTNIGGGGRPTSLDLGDILGNGLVMPDTDNSFNPGNLLSTASGLFGGKGRPTAVQPDPSMILQMQRNGTMVDVPGSINWPGASTKLNPFGTTQSNASISGGTMQAQTYQFFKGKGLADHQIAGIMGNIHRESNFNPNAVNPNGGATGIFQHLGPRKTALQNFGGVGDGMKQLEFAWQEMQGPESKALSRLRASTDVRSATEAFGSFERAEGFNRNGNLGADLFDINKRTGYANDYMQQIQSGAFGSSTLLQGAAGVNDLSGMQFNDVFRNMENTMDGLMGNLSASMNDASSAITNLGSAAGNGASGIGSFISSLGSMGGGGGGGGGGGFFGSLLSGIGSLFGFANGGVFGTPTKFANGGVVNGPTGFGYQEDGQFKRGLMGEAGPEAIMPLERGSDGKLGVRATGGSQTRGHTTVINNFIVKDKAQSARSRNQMAMNTTRAVERAQRIA